MMMTLSPPVPPSPMPFADDSWNFEKTLLIIIGVFSFFVVCVYLIMTRSGGGISPLPPRKGSGGSWSDAADGKGPVPRGPIPSTTYGSV